MHNALDVLETLNVWKLLWLKIAGADGRAGTVIMKDKWGINYMWNKIPRNGDVNEDENEDNKEQSWKESVFVIIPKISFLDLEIYFILSVIMLKYSILKGNALNHSVYNKIIFKLLANVNLLLLKFIQLHIFAVWYTYFQK